MSMSRGEAIDTRHFRSRKSDVFEPLALSCERLLRIFCPIEGGFGGRVDRCSPYPTDFGGEVVNFAINHRVRVKKREEVERF